MKVRGPALAKLGFQPTAKGLVEYMDCREPKDDLSGLSDAHVATAAGLLRSAPPSVAAADAAPPEPF